MQAGIESKPFHLTKAELCAVRIFMTNSELILTNPYRPHWKCAFILFSTLLSFVTL